MKAKTKRATTKRTRKVRVATKTTPRKSTKKVAKRVMSRAKPAAKRVRAKATKHAAKKKVVRLVAKQENTGAVAKEKTSESSKNKSAVEAVARKRSTEKTAASDRPTLSPGNATREECLRRYLPLVRYVVEKVAAGIPRHVDHEDLISAGVLGLLNAYDKFDTGKGTKFETYAVWRIRGAVLDQLRSLDWASRSTRRMGREMDSCARALDQKLGRTATDQEIARGMKITLADYFRLVDRVRGSVLVSLDETRRGEEGDTLGLSELLEDPKSPDVLASIEQEETKGFLHTTLSRLPEQERLVMALYYYEQMTLREIGEALGISESRVSQIHTRAVERLRGRVHRALAS